MCPNCLYLGSKNNRGARTPSTNLDNSDCCRVDSNMLRVEEFGERELYEHLIGRELMRCAERVLSIEDFEYLMEYVSRRGRRKPRTKRLERVIHRVREAYEQG
ncbi:MAG: hypothetical protein KatS3mg019_0926 [Fimbriimonadales bacterium]|nr:MAG: hypothetical protein KatS3mg019_0926 [Fimbriimonadales bacterium]